MQYNTATREQYTVLPTVVSLTFYELDCRHTWFLSCWIICLERSSCLSQEQCTASV